MDDLPRVVQLIVVLGFGPRQSDSRACTWSNSGRVEGLYLQTPQALGPVSHWPQGWQDPRLMHTPTPLTSKGPRLQRELRGDAHHIPGWVCGEAQESQSD